MWLPSKSEMGAAEGTNPRLPWDTMATGPLQGQREGGLGHFKIKIAFSDLLFAEHWVLACHLQIVGHKENYKMFNA